MQESIKSRKNSRIVAEKIKSAEYGKTMCTSPLTVFLKGLSHSTNFKQWIFVYFKYTLES